MSIHSVNPLKLFDRGLLLMHLVVFQQNLVLFLDYMTCFCVGNLEGNELSFNCFKK